MNIGLYGDSTQVGASVYAGVVHQAEWTPAKIVQMMLDHKYGAGVHVVSNYGIGGSTISGALGTTIFPGGKTFAQHMAAQSDDIIVANWGINDAYLPGYTAANHKAHYTTLKNAVETAGKVFVYQSPNPLNMPHDPILSTNDAAVKTIAGIKLADINSQIKSVYPQWAYHLSDGVHPNSIMYAFMGEMLFNRIDALL